MSRYYGIVGFIIMMATGFILGEFILEKYTTVPAYYVDTSAYGIGGITIPKTNAREDKIAICKATRKFELQILQRLETENNLKSLVGNCD